MILFDGGWGIGSWRLGREFRGGVFLGLWSLVLFPCLLLLDLTLEEKT